MIPIHELLNRIKWDKSFGSGRFVIGYYDRVDHTIHQLPLQEIFFEKGDHFSFDFMDDQGVLHTVPLHRIKQVYRDDELIWRREH